MWTNDSRAMRPAMSVKLAAHPWASFLAHTIWKAAQVLSWTALLFYPIRYAADMCE